MKVTTNAKKGLHKGFSLVEMLVVIAIIGVIAAIAIPQITNISDNAEEGKNRRNAQNLASVCAAAQAAGHDFVALAADPTSETEIVGAIVTGATVTSGAFTGEFFGVPGLSAADQTAAITYLLAEDGALKYNP